MELLDRVKNLVEQGQGVTQITAIVEQLETVAVLPEVLRNKLDAMGDTPLSEPKVFEAIQLSMAEGKAVIALNVLSEEEITQMLASDVGNFIYAVEQRITSHRNSDGAFKSTPNTEGCKQPNFLECEVIRSLLLKRDALGTTWMSADKAGKDAAIRDFEGLVKEMTETLLKISGLDADVLTDWEAGLVIAQMIASANDAFLSATGKR